MFAFKTRFIDSPHKYTESEVTLQYRRPVRNEIKEEWSEEDLANKQAEAMRRIYQEEKRRKYLQELQDMSNRRHADNLLLVVMFYNRRRGKLFFICFE